MQDTLNPQDLAQKTTREIMDSLKPNNTEDILAALQKHYDVLNKTQEMYIEFLTGFVDNLKHLQRKDKESLDDLKKQVLTHVLKNQ